MFLKTAENSKHLLIGEKGPIEILMDSLEKEAFPSGEAIRLTDADPQSAQLFRR